MKPQPLARVRLYPEKDTDYRGPTAPRRFVGVQLWPSERRLAAYLRYRGFAHVRGTQGQCLDLNSWPKAKRWWAPGAVAEVNLHRNALGTEIVAHEMFHAALAWARWCGADVITGGDGEERIAYLLGNLVREFVRFTYADGFRD